MNRLNKRRIARFPSNLPVALRWRPDSGETRFSHGAVLDYSENGLCVELSEPIQAASYVLVGSRGRNRKAWTGWVRYCLAKQTQYIVGLEYSLDIEPDGSRPDLDKLLQNPQFSMLTFRP